MTDNTDNTSDSSEPTSSNIRTGHGQKLFKPSTSQLNQMSQQSTQPIGATHMPLEEPPLAPPDPGAIFDTSGFRISWMTYIMLLLLVLFPLSNVMVGGDPAEDIKTLANHPMLFYIGSIIMLWLIFGSVYFSVWAEGQTLRGIGFTRLRGLHILQGLTFFLVSAVVLKGIEFILAEMGYHAIGELSLLLPDTASERIWWVALSLTAGICEEAAFRGYFMTRFRAMTPSSWSNAVRWTLPIVVSAILFGMGHTYQGVTGVVMITAYGVMISLLFLYTRSIWPCVVAHFLLDFINIFVPLLESNTN